jgi:phenylalanyl-tRNA synthetase beta subunit
VLQGAQATPTPDWMATRLKQIEQNVHNSLIDITNYVTHDLGHPCHAFDYDKIMDQGGTIIVKQAEPNQAFTTLDDEQYQTVGGEIVFENQAGDIIDLPAIKGTKNTSIGPDTENILFWIENLDAQKVRFASMTHAIRTVAAQLNEKGVDPYLGKTVLTKAVNLYQELAQAQIASPVYDDFPQQEKAVEERSITVSQQTIDAYLGLELPTQDIKQILTDLGCRVQFSENEKSKTQNQRQEKSAKRLYHILPPTFRPDLQIPADIVEEIARIYGYHQLPSKLMATPIPTQQPTNADFRLEQRLKNFLAALGWQEIYSYSAVSQNLAQQAGHDLSAHLKLANPLTEDHVYLRRSLIPSLNQAIDRNTQQQPAQDKSSQSGTKTKAGNKKAAKGEVGGVDEAGGGSEAQKKQVKALSVFELASCYHPQTIDRPSQDKQNKAQEPQLPNQSLTLGLVSAQDYRHFRRDLEALLGQLYIKQVKIGAEVELQSEPAKPAESSKPNQPKPAQASQPRFYQQQAPLLGKSQKQDEFTQLGQIYVLANGRVAAQLDYQALLKARAKYPRYQAPAKTSTIIEDMTFTLPEQTKIGRVLETIKSSHEWLQQVELKDQYQRNYTFTLTYQDRQQNLTTDDIAALRKKVSQLLTDHYAAQLVGEV